MTQSTFMIDYNEYYSKPVSLSEIGRKGQEQLRSGKCLVVGAGGLGSSALYYLASAGIGTLGICDFDRLEVTNLHRQILYAAKDIGSSKATLAAETLRQLNPFINVAIHNTRLTHTNCQDVLSGYDLVLDCTDNFRTKFLLNDASYLFNIPLIRASIYRFEGQLQCYLPSRSEACLRCLWPEVPQDGCVGSCADVGVLGPLPGFFGVLQAMEALKFFLNLPLLQTNSLLVYDLISHTQNILTLSRQEQCPLCGIAPMITNLNPHSLLEIEAHNCSFDHYQLIDIREKEETIADPLRVLKSLHMPLSSFDVLTLNPAIPYLFFCHRGRRSLNLVTRLRAEGWNNVYSLTGGIISLKQEIST
jgi:molybdopterin/thiamine biosynthesis adenylyltransferase/rhodanese-related sulfurtransferase